MVITRIADGIWRQIEAAQDTMSETLFEPVIRLGVTGLARSGKTVFITSLVANLLNRGRMPGLLAASEGRIEAAFLQPQPNDTLPRFDYETHLAALTGKSPHWPESTRAISELRLSLKVRPNGLLAGLKGLRTVHLDIVDYPGEWLLDLGLMNQSYEDWSAETLSRIKDRKSAKEFMELIGKVNPLLEHEESLAQDLARQFATYLKAARGEGFSDCTPGRFLLPGDLAGSPVLTFAPIPVEGSARRGSLHREMARRFEAYKQRVVQPFFRDHFARIDRQIVLVDALGAIHEGPQAVDDLRQAMREILNAFRPGRNSFLMNLLGGKRVEKILFAATKADHLHHSQHGKLSAIMEALIREARDHAQYVGAGTAAMAIASLRATTEAVMEHDGTPLNVVRGTLLDTGKEAAFYPGDLPSDPAHLLNPARGGAMKWLDQDYQVMRFAPAPLALRPGDGPPHIRLDRAAEFLIGDRL
ncbi:YcjX family protein [Sulfitobacter sp. F26204]|uniref:YcjX family protein n=1 Tax=Sulfitobacter sp. F26204 TaxID=2996014 RepID=UPI00225E1EE8|nr:YcjX family protein [Sulfitobacter sp. F26204]MCX7558997.1 YcjX family protein [Sulfitobacter sp. F26204]